MILSVENIYKSFRKQKVLRNISFNIEKPAIIALVGPNGSGKSTLMNILTNILQPDQGCIHIFGKQHPNPSIFYEIAFMQDNSILYDYLSGYDHLKFICEIQHLTKKHLLNAAKMVGMEGYLHKRVKHYSLGMKQHLLLTMAIIHKPKLLILDEPLNGIDPTSAIRIRNLLLSLYKKGTTILLSSHQLREIDQVTSKVLFLKDGQLINEDISKYKDVGFLLKVDDIKKAQELLSIASFDVDTTINGILVNCSASKLGRVIKILNQSRIEIHDVDKAPHGAEQRYKQIFIHHGSEQ